MIVEKKGIMLSRKLKKVKPRRMKLLSWFWKFLLVNQVMITSLALLHQLEKSKRWINRRDIVCDFYKDRRTISDLFPKWFENLKRNPKLFFRYTRMDVDLFYLILDRIKPHLPHKKKSCDAIPPEERLMITLR